MSDVRLPVPVRKVLTESLDDAALTRQWERLAASRSAPAVPRIRPWIIALASALVAAALALLVVRRSTPAALHLADGREIPAQMAAGAKAHLSFDDASNLDVGAGTHLDLLETTGRAFGMAMRIGTIEADVEPGGPRLWRIECGPVTVEVVGTHFTVERTARFVRVAVDRGAVLVRGDPVPDRVVRIDAGHSIVVPLLAPASSDANAVSPPRGAPATTDERDDRAATPTLGAVQGSKPSTSTHASTGESTAPVPSSEAAAAPSAASSVVAFPAPEPAAHVSVVDAALSEADSLRRSGRYAEAARVLERALAEHGTEPSAPLAEFSLGRLYLDSVGNPGLASAHLAGAIARGLPSALAEDAQARLVEARARAGDPLGAQSAAAKYHAIYPEGRHSSEVDRWISSAP